MISAKMAVVNPDDTEFTLQITMPLKRWREIMHQLDSKAWPSWELCSVVRKAIDKASAEYRVETEISSG